MTGNRFIRRGIRSDLEPKLGRAFLVSFSLHLFLFLLFSGVILPRLERERAPVYFVDLVNLPVAKPQAGRPDAAPKESSKKPAEKKSSPQAEKKMVAPVTKTEPKKAAPTAVVRSGPSDADIATKIARMQEKEARQKEINALKQKLAAMAAEDKRGEENRGERAAPQAPVGVPDGTGDEAGVSWQLWLQAYLKEQWALSEYQVTRLDLEAVVFLQYDKTGRLTDFRFLKKSNDRIFDDSVRTAILKSQQLDNKPPGPVWQVEVVFNLKDLLDRR